MHQSLICYSFPGIVTFLLVLPYLVYAVPEPENKTEEVKRDSKSRWYTVKDLVWEKHGSVLTFWELIQPLKKIMYFGSFCDTKSLFALVVKSTYAQFMFSTFEFEGLFLTVSVIVRVRGKLVRLELEVTC